MASSESDSTDRAGRVHLESLAANASAARALDDLYAEDAEGRLQPPIDLTAAAFFDVDNTLVQGSSAVHFGRGLAARNYFTYRDVLGFIYAQTKFQLLGKENSNDVAAGRRVAPGQGSPAVVPRSAGSGDGLVGLRGPTAWRRTSAPRPRRRRIRASGPRAL